MGPRVLFWLAVAMAAMGAHSPEGNLFYFIAVHSSMLMIGSMLCRREKRGRKAAPATASSSKSAPADPKAKPA